MKLNPSELKVYIENDRMRRRIKLYFLKHTYDESFILSNTGEWVTSEEGHGYDASKTGYILPNDSLQSLADELGNMGIYANKVQDYKNELNATRYHLEDMRSLIFKDKKIENKVN